MVLLYSSNRLLLLLPELHSIRLTGIVRNLIQKCTGMDMPLLRIFSLSFLRDVQGLGQLQDNLEISTKASLKHEATSEAFMLT